MKRETEERYQLTNIIITINYYMITMAIARVNILLHNDRHARVRTWERLLFLGFQVLMACARA